MNDKKEKLFLCVEIGGTHLRVGVVTEAYTLESFFKVPSEKLSEAEDKGEYFQQLLNPVVEKYGRNRFYGISLSLASLMNRESMFKFT